MKEWSDNQVSKCYTRKSPYISWISDFLILHLEAPRPRGKAPTELPCCFGPKHVDSSWWVGVCTLHLIYAESCYTWLLLWGFPRGQVLLWIAKFTKVFLVALGSAGGKFTWQACITEQRPIQLSGQWGQLIRSKNGFSPVTGWKETPKSCSDQSSEMDTGKVKKWQRITAESLELTFHFFFLWTPWP